MEETKSILQKELEELKKAIEYIDSTTDLDENNRDIVIKVVVKKIVNLRIKIYKETHGLPHVHIATRKNHHSASVAIESLKILAGSIEKKEEKTVLAWIKKNKIHLLKIWNNIQKDQEFDLSTLT